jgi:hypothetical protein
LLITSVLLFIQTKFELNNKRSSLWDNNLSTLRQK